MLLFPEHLVFGLVGSDVLDLRGVVLGDGCG